MRRIDDWVRRGYEAWLVDLDGTLYDARPVKLAMAAELALSGWGSVATLRRFRKEHEALRDEQARGDGGAGATGDPFARQIERTATALGAPAEDVEQRVREWMIQRPGRWLARFKRDWLIEDLRVFRETGGRTALVSDYPARDKLRAMHLEELFEVVVASGEADGPAALKPSPDGYQRAARALGVAPERCLVLGDRDDADGEAARAAGMQFRLIR